MILLAYWLLLIVLSAFFLRLACGLCRTGLPSWRRSIISVCVVTFLAYVAGDFTAYLMMRSFQDVLIQVPPGYGYNIWFREPIALKWAIISMAGPLRYLPIVFALCAAGVLQMILLEAEVTFRFGLLIVLLQWGATAVAGYLLGLIFGVALGEFGRTTQSAAGSTSLQVMKQEMEGAVQAPREYLQSAAKPLKAYADSHLEQLEEDLAPMTRHLPEPIQHFLAGGGWWVVIGILVVLALVWLRSLLRRLVGALSGPRRRKRRRTKKVDPLKVNLRELGEGFTESGPERLTVKGVPARMRLVILSRGSRNTGDISEEMADRVLDWIKEGLAGATAADYPRMVVWPPFYSVDGFATALAAHVAIPEPKGRKSRWVIVAGHVKMGPSFVHVGLGLYADEATTLRNLQVRGEKWVGVLGIQKANQPVGAR